MTRKKIPPVLLLLSVISSAALAQSAPDSALLADIRAIRAVDDHAHPAALHSDPASDEFDPPPNVPPLGPPALLRETNPQYRAADRYLFNLSREGNVSAARRAMMREKGDTYPSWILDQLGIETMLANRHALGAGLAIPRFRLVWFADPLVFPLSNQSEKTNPQRRGEFDDAEKWLAKYVAESGLRETPRTLDEYLSRFVFPLLQKKKRDGAVAIKFALAYMRDLRISTPSHASAAQVFARYRNGGTPSSAEYRAVQDYIIRSVVREAGRLGMPVQIHVGAGSGPFFDNAGADPFLLMPLLLDSAMRQTTFVLVHGGFPSAANTRVLFAKPNVYVDFSSQAFLSSTHELSEVLRKWLEFRPEKVMFGTDAYAVSTTVGWEEVAWMTNESSRRALAIALTGMMNDGSIDRAQALHIARMVMRETAISLYGLQ